MSKFFTDLFRALGHYYRDFISNGYQGLWLPIVALLGVLLLAALWVRWTGQKAPQSRESHILNTLVICASVGGLVLISTYSYLWANTEYYQKNNHQFVHLFSLLVLLITLFLLLLRYAGLFGARKVRSLYLPAFSPGENGRFNTRARLIFRRLKFWLLLPVLGFTMLLFLLSKPDYLVAILIDNSSSMDENIETGKAALGQTFSEFDGHTDFIVSWFTERNPKSDMRSIRAIKQWNRLEGNHAYFSDATQALQHLEAVDLTGGTPLYETIYSQYLYAVDQTANSNYGRKVLIIVTDGEEGYLKNDPRALQQLLCTDPDFDAFWDEVGVMNLGGNLSGPFYDLVMNECQYYVEEDATGLSSYMAGVDTMVNAFKHDWNYPRWLIIITSLWLVSSFLIKPKL